MIGIAITERKSLRGIIWNKDSLSEWAKKEEEEESELLKDS